MNLIYRKTGKRNLDSLIDDLLHRRYLLITESIGTVYSLEMIPLTLNDFLILKGRRDGIFLDLRDELLPSSCGIGCD